MSAALTRRAALSGAVASVALVGAAAAATMPIPARASAVSPELTALIAAVSAAQEACNRYNEVEWAAASKRFDTAQAAIARIPHKTFDAGPTLSGTPITWTTADPAHVAVSKTIVDMAAKGQEFAPAYVLAARKLRAAAARRKRQVERAIEAARQSSGLAKASDEMDALGTAWVDAEDAALAFPARTPADLAIKMECAIKWDRQESHYDLLLADARRVAGMQG